MPSYAAGTRAIIAEVQALRPVLEPSFVAKNIVKIVKLAKTLQKRGGRNRSVESAVKALAFRARAGELARGIGAEFELWIPHGVADPAPEFYLLFKDHPGVRLL